MTRFDKIYFYGMKSFKLAIMAGITSCVWAGSGLISDLRFSIKDGKRNASEGKKYIKEKATEIQNTVTQGKQQNYF